MPANQWLEIRETTMGFARLNSFFWSYFKIAQKAKAQFDNTFEIDEEPSLEKDSDLYFELRSKRFEYGVQVIVFSAMTMESLINDYSSIKLGDSFFRNHIDKLNTVSKLLVVTQMKSDKEFPKEGQAFEHLDLLFKIRNKLVHSKSKALPFNNGEVDSDKLTKMEEGYLNNWKETVDDCFLAIPFCAETLNNLDLDDHLFLAFKSIVSN